MAELHKAFQVRLMPTEEQTQAFEQHVGCSRLIYNWALNEKIEAYKDEVSLSNFDLHSYLTEYKQSRPFLQDVHINCLRQAVNDMDIAFKNFFNSHSGKRKGRVMGFPRFKSKHTARKSFRIVQASRTDRCIRTQGTTLRIPKIGFVEVANAKKRLERFDSFRIKYVTIFQDSDSFWYASVLCAVDESQVRNHIVAATNAVVGLDVGVKTTVTQSDGAKVDIPTKIIYLKSRIAKLQEKMSKMRGPGKGIPPSKHWLAAKKKLGKLHCRLKNIRKDWQHKYSMWLIRNNQTIVMETLNIQGMVKKGGVSKQDFNDKVLTAAWYQLKTFIKYKAQWYGRELLEVDKYFPSTQLCSHCGQQNKVEELRRYSCSGCGTIHDRDINAAVNLQTVGYWHQATGELIANAGQYQYALTQKQAM